MQPNAAEVNREMLGRNINAVRTLAHDEHET